MRTRMWVRLYLTFMLLIQLSGALVPDLRPPPPDIDSHRAGLDHHPVMVSEEDIEESGPPTNDGNSEFLVVVPLGDKGIYKSHFIEDEDDGEDDTADIQNNTQSGE